MWDVKFNDELNNFNRYSLYIANIYIYKRLQALYPISIDFMMEIILSNDYYKLPTDTMNFYIAFINSKFIITPTLDALLSFISNLFNHYEKD